MKKLFCILLMSVLSFSVAGSQGMQVKEVRSFCGGLAPSLPNLQDDQALVLINFDLEADEDDAFCSLHRRPGMELHYADDDSLRGLQGIFTYYGLDKKTMLVRRLADGHYDDDSLNTSVSVIAECPPCTTTVDEGFYYPGRYTERLTNQAVATVNDNIVIAGTKSEMVLYDGDSLFYARPYGPGQPRITVLDGGGNLHGKFRYKYAFIDTTSGDTSHFSCPSWYGYVDSGKVLVELEGPVDTTTQDKILIARNQCYGGLSESGWLVVTSMNAASYYDTSLFFIDTTVSNNLTDTATYNWGWDTKGMWNVFADDDLLPPGGMNLSASASGILGNSIFEGHGADSIADITVCYRVVYVDSAGRESYSSAISVKTIDSTETNADTMIYIHITNIPVPVDNDITKKYLYRRLDVNNYDSGPYDLQDSKWTDWHLVDTLGYNTETYNDTKGIASADSATVVCTDQEEVEPRYLYGDSVKIDTCQISPEYMCYDDSTIDFTPSDIAYHGSRLYVIGHPEHKDRLFYSDFGRPTCFAPDHFLQVPGQDGDWFTALVSMSSDVLLAFRQNSIVTLEGLSYYQYNLNEGGGGIGCSAPETVQRSRLGTFFAHQTGLYGLSSPEPLSLAIQSVVDSCAGNIPTSVGRIIGNEYWWSVGPITNNRTYVYSARPRPHWRSYSFGMKDAMLFDYTTATSYSTDKWIILRENDSLYRWGYTDTATTDAGVSFTATYQSGYFFEGGGRENIYWVDLDGKGSVDSLRLIYYRRTDSNKAGVPFDTVTIYPDFTDETVDRANVQAICDQFSLRIEDFGAGDYAIKGYKIWYQPWDGGRQ